MLKNYFKVALNVLKRNKFYTFISLFGISFTLMVLMLSIAFFQNELGSNKPLSKKNRTIFVPVMGMKAWQKEVTKEIDTSYVDGIAVYDTTITEKPIIGHSTSSSNSTLGLDFVKEHILPMKSTEMISMYSAGGILDVYPNNQKLQLKTIYTDANYWKIFDFEFIEGQPLSSASVENQAREIVIAEDAAEKYFGKHSQYLGKELKWGNQFFKVTGVIKPVNTSARGVNSDIYMPYTHLPKQALNYRWGFGGMQVALLASSPKQLDQVIAELRHIERTAPIPEGRYDARFLYEKNLEDLYAWGITAFQEDRGGRTFMSIILGALGLFLLIPTLNLINLNVTRIMERSSEIGVRKAFGARTQNLMFQFLFENIIITLIGGVLGLVLTYIVMYWLNSNAVFEDTHLAFNTTIFLLSLLITLVFGICSGLIPAWRMARTQVAQAIKRNKL